jgi:hypothetical protein
MRTSWISILTFAAGCSMMHPSSSTVPLHSTDRTPAATGEVRAIPAPNGNTNVTITVDHLAPPERIARDATAYVVWIVPKGDSVQGSTGTAMPTNAGQIRLGSDLHAELQVVTPYKDFQVQITPERSAMEQQPTAPPVLSASVDRG